MVLARTNGDVSEFGVAEFGGKKDILVEFDAIGDFGLVLEAGHEFEVAFLVGELKFDGAIVFLILDDVGIGKVLVREFVPE